MNKSILLFASIQLLVVIHAKGAVENHPFKESIADYFYQEKSSYSSAITKSEYQIKGIVVDTLSGDGISYVTITIQNSEEVVKRLAGDASGKFQFSLDNPGTYDVVFHSVGYRLQKVAIVITGPELNYDMGTVYLKPSVEELGEVTVAVQKPLIRTEPDKIVYSIESDPESKTSNVLEMLRKVPLITVDGEDNIEMKGSSNFKILVNGKHSSMISQNPKEILRSLPASTVRDIEVITEPSTKYEAEGVGGIINIITTKKQLEGFLVRANAGIDTRGGYNTGVYATSKIKKFGFSVNYGYNKFLQPTSESWSERENFLSASNRFTESEGSNNYSGKMNFLMGEASYEIDTLNLISLSFMGHFGNFSGLSDSWSKDFDLNRSLTRHFLNETDMVNGYGHLSGNIDYQRTFNKPDKTFTVSYRLENSPRSTENESGINGILDYPSYRQRTLNDAIGREHTFQLDYYDPLTKVHQVESGVKFILRQNISNSDIYRFDSYANDWIRDLSRINDLDYNQYILGVYMGYVVKIKGFNLKTGLRAESTQNDGLFQSTKDTTFTNKLFNLIPYVSFSKNLKKEQNIRFSYTHRLSRPGIWYLNPFVNDADPLNIRYGNPNLEAEIAHSFNFTYGRFTPKYSLNFNLSSTFGNNAITPYTTLSAEGVSITTYENIGRNRNFGGYLYGSVKIGKKINLNSNLGVDYAILERNTGQELRNEGARYNGSLSVRYNTWENGTVSMRGGFYSPRIMLQGQSSAYSYSNLSFSQQFFEKKLMVSCSVTDPFRKRMVYTNTLKDETFTRISKSYRYNRMFRIYLSYQVGQMKDQIKKARRTISNEDLKSGGDSGQSGGGEKP